MTAIVQERFQPEVFELKYTIRLFVTQFPPPFTDKIEEVITRLKECAQWGECSIDRILDDVFFELNTRNPHTGYLEALRAVLESSIDPMVHPWPDTLKIVSEEWATWAAPWVKAAEFEYKNDNFETAKTYLESAHRLMPVAKKHFRAIVDKYRRAVERRNGNHIHQLFAVSLIATHAPTISNLNEYIELALKLRIDSDIDRTLGLCWSLHGRDPYKWTVLEQYDELASAGALCIAINKASARKGLDHNFLLWNKAAIDYLKRAHTTLRDSGRVGSKERHYISYISFRLGDAYASMLRFFRNQGGQEERQLLLNEARDFILVLGRSSSSNVYLTAYTAQRQLVEISVEETRYARETLLPQSEIDALVDRADEDFSNLSLFALPKDRANIVKQHSLFLAEFERFDKALKLARNCEDYNVEVDILYRSGSTEESVNKLISLLNSSNKHATALQYAQRLFHYLEEGELRGIVLSKGILVEARDCLKNRTGYLIGACINNLNDGDIEQSKRNLRIARYTSDDPLAPNFVHLSARIGLVEIAYGRSPDNVLSELTTAFYERPILRSDPFCRSIFLQILAKGATISSLNPDTVWDIATDISGEPEQQYDPYNLYHALRWQIYCGQLNGWVGRVLFASRLFPEDHYIERLPKRLWDARGAEASKILVRLFEQASSYEEVLWVARALDSIPGAFFFTDSVSDTVAEFISSRIYGDTETKQIVRIVASTFIEGFVKGQLEVWGTPALCQERTLFAATWICLHIPDNLLSDKWSQWLGSQRSACEDAVVRRLRTKVEQLKHNLVNSEDKKKETWLKQLNDFFTEMREAANIDSNKRESLTKDGETVVLFCAEAVINYNPSIPDPDYWRDLNALVSQWKVNIPLEELPQAMTQVWIQLHLRIEGVIAKHIVDVTLPAIHSYKTDIADLSISDIQREWVERFQTVIDKTMEYLKWHRWPVRASLDLRKILEDVAYNHPFTQIHRDVSLSAPRLWAVRPSFPVKVNGDYELLAELVRSLLDNACQYTPSKDQGGWIWAEVKRENQWAVLKVIDKGSGVSSEILERLNDPFGRPFSGGNSTGYGTRLCHRVTQLHQGSMKFHSDGPGTGLTVEVRLPLAGRENEVYAY